MSNKIQKLLKELQAVKDCRFVSFTYQAKGTGEIARHNFATHYDYAKLLRRDLSKVESMSFQGVKELARQELLKSLRNSLDCLASGVENAAYTRKDSDIALGEGLSLNLATNTLRVRGLSIKKLVIQQGEVKKVNSSEKTLAKREIEKCLAKSKIREFILDAENLQVAKLNGKKIELNKEN